MSRITGSVCRICRRERTKLYLKGEKCFTAKCPVSRRSYPPGIHGPESRAQLTEYGKQLREKQRAKNIYGIGERQFALYYKRATREPVTGEALLRFLEMRLDNAVFKAGFAQSRAQARQFVNHGNVIVNGKSITIPSYQLKVGDVFTLTQKLHKNPAIIRMQERTYTPPKWLKTDPKQCKGEVGSKPEKEELAQEIDATMIVEFYSK